MDDLDNGTIEVREARPGDLASIAVLLDQLKEVMSRRFYEIMGFDQEYVLLGKEL
jgi:hypothetical protein